VISLVLFVASLAAAAPPQQPKAGNALICYYFNGAIYRTNTDCEYNPSYIDANLCTHIIYSYAKTEGDESPTLSSSDPNADLPSGRDGYNKVTALKKENPDLKVLLATGGFNQGGIPLSKAFHTASSRSNFAKNSIEFLKSHGFDGLSVDWFWPGNGGPSDWDNLRSAGKTLRAAYDAEGMIISTVVSALPDVMPKYDHDGLNYFHFVIVWNMEFRGFWDHRTGPPTAIYRCDEDTFTEAAKLNVDNAIQYYLGAGVKPIHLVTVTTTEGRSFKLSDSADHKIGSPTLGWGGEWKPCTLTNGILGFNEFCPIMDDGWRHHEAKECSAEYHHKGDQWISLESPSTMYAHGKYAVANGLAGAAVFSLDMDDFHGLCGPKYALTNGLKQGLNGGEVDTTTPGPTKPTTEEPTNSYPITKPADTTKPKN